MAGMDIGYARVSTEEQNLDLQLQALEASGCAHIFEDQGVSGAAIERPGLAQALAAAERGDVLVVWKLDRLGRSLPHLVEVINGLREAGIGFRSLQEQRGADVRGFKYRPLKHPVIVLIDNDEGSKNLLATLANNYGITVILQSPDPFFHVTDNLYLVKTPERGASGASCIEDLFDPALLERKLDGKKFNLKKTHGADGEYGKFLFAEKIVRAEAGELDFTGFAPLLERIVAVIDHYSPPAALSPAAQEE